MLADSLLRDLFARGDLGRSEKLLLCLAVNAETPKEVKAIKALATSHGLRAAKTWNVSGYLRRTKGLASRVADGWVLTKPGRDFIASLGLSGSTVVTLTSAALRRHAASIRRADTLAFVNEAVSCFEAHLYRGAVVLSWVGAVSVLYDHVVTTCLTVFNTEAGRRYSKFRPAVTRDDLARLKESDFLDVLEGISVIGKSVRKELGVCLDLRNGCGHPNSLRIAEARVTAHIETLILNVFTQF